jgi:hypothetical protein
MTFSQGLINQPTTGAIDQEETGEGQSPQQTHLDLVNIKLSEEDRQKLGHRLWYEINRYNAYTETRRGNVEQWRRDWEAFPTGRSTRWKNASDVPAPLTRVYCNNHTTRLNQQIIKAVPPFTAVASTTQALDYAPDIEEALTHVLEKADWQIAADEVHNELPIVGNCLLRVTFEIETRHVPRHNVELDDENFGLQLTAGQDFATAYWDSIKKDEDGTPTAHLDYEDVMTYSGVRFKVIPWEDSVIMPVTVRDPEDAYGIGQRLMIRGEDLIEGAAEGKYIKDAVDEVLTRQSYVTPRDRIERYDVQGIIPTSSGGNNGLPDRDPAYQDYMCYELNWRMDANNDGKMEWVIVTIHYDSKTILRLQYLPYEHGEPYYHLFRYIPRVRELFWMSVSEVIATYQDAATAVLNQIIDAQDYQLNMFGNFFYDSTSGLDPNKFELQLGRPIRVDSVEGIKPIDFKPLPQEAYQVYQLFKEVCDLLTATSNPTLGKVTESSKTLGEVQLVAAASGMQFEEVASRVARTWAKVWDQVRKLEAQYALNGLVKFRRRIAPAGQIIDSIPREVLLEEVELIPTGLKQLADMQSRVQQATIVQNTLLMHPLTGPNTDVQIVLLDTYLQAVNYPQKDKIMEIVYRAVNAMRQVQMMEQQGMLPEQQAGMQGPPGAPPPPQGGAVPGGAPPGAPPSPHTAAGREAQLAGAQSQAPFSG